MNRLIAYIVVLMGPMAGWGQSISLPVDELKKDAAPAEGTVVDEAKKKEEENKEKKVERIQVTGSHIKRIDVEGASPVQTITRKDLEKSGKNSVSDVLRESTISSFGGLREDSGSSAAGQASINLRGLGSTNTLVLMDGQRLPTDPVTGAVDVNLIPMAAIERVEVLKDGASATYGSDALGGVVNLITRKDFSGTEASIAQTTPEMKGGRQTQISLVNGFSTRRLNMVNVLQHRDNEITYDRDRPWNDGAYSPTGSPGTYRSVTRDADGNVTAAQPFVPGAGCPPELQESIGTQGTRCKFKYTDYSSALPELKQTSFLSNANFEASSRVRLNARAGATRKDVFWKYAPAPGQFYIPANVADQMNNGTPLPGAVAGQDLDFRYRTVELGTRDTQIRTDAYSGLLGATVDVGGGWETNVVVNHSRQLAKERGIAGFALTDIVTQDVETGAFNPYTGAGSLENSRYVPVKETVSAYTAAEVKATGPIVEMPAGPLSIAVGAQFSGASFKDQNDDRSINGEVFASPGASGTAQGSRDIQAAYTELSVPVTKKLELQLAARHDKYSDFGSATSPKAAFLYKATPELLFRGSVGTGFKAPLLMDMYAATSSGFPTFVDRRACNADTAAGQDNGYCDPQQYAVTSGGNPNLKEERSLSYNAGVLFEPNRDFNIGTDLFLTKVKNVVSTPDLDDVMEADARGTDLSAYGIIIHRDVNGYLDPNLGVEAPTQNLASQEIAGVDFDTSYQFWKMKAGVSHSHLFWYKLESVPGLGLRNRLGEKGLPPWRNVVSLSYYPGERHDLTLFAPTIAGQQKETKEGRLENFTALNAQYSYKTKSFGTFTVGVNNVFNTTPPLDDTVPTEQFSVNLYDQVLRSYYTAYKATF